ncbi:DUF4114 domain-containing protein [Mucisphaera sp.]|uniref:DUF4114 domain-containing protein n=1 Tax=Mucisphaera sp. TaxID=2913024 RepID=UPI003D0F06CE
MKTIPHPILAIAAVWLLAAPTAAGQVSPFQSEARPLGLEPIAPVMLRGTDEASRSFLINDLPTLESLVDERLAEGVALEDAPLMRFDPSRLVLEHETRVRVYFLGEGAGYRNSFGFFKPDVMPGDAVSLGPDNGFLVFPDASTSASYFDQQLSGRRTSQAPLLPGDYVDLGLYPAGSALLPFLIPNGANGNSEVYTSDVSQNSDGLQHVVALGTGHSGQLLLGFEDLPGGGDLDYNDLVAVIEIGQKNITSLPEAVVVPTPPAMIGGGVILLGLVLQRSRWRRASRTYERGLRKWGVR